MTHRFCIYAVDGICKGYVTVGLYEDGTPGELFVKVDRQGGVVSGFADAWAISVSMLLQVGVPVADLCRKFAFSRFEPSGRTDTKAIPVALSVIDYVARWLELKFPTTEATT